MLSQWNTLKKVLIRIRRYWPTLIAAIILATVNVGMTLYIPILVGSAIDCIVDAGQVDFDQMWIFLRGVILCAAIGGLHHAQVRPRQQGIELPQ